MPPAIRVVEESDLSDQERRQAANLLAAEWGDAWRPDAYAGPYPPQFRVLSIESDGTLVAHLSAFAIRTASTLTLYGLGDLVILPSRRRGGLATAISAAAVKQCWDRGADTILVDTLAARSIFAGLGFESVTSFRFFYVEDNRCTRREHWMVAQRQTVAEPIELLEHGDF